MRPLNSLGHGQRDALAVAGSWRVMGIFTLGTLKGVAGGV